MPLARKMEASQERMIKDFSRRQKAFHTLEHARELEKVRTQGEIEKDINLALQNLRNRGALEVGEQSQRGAMTLQRDQHDFLRPEQRERILQGVSGREREAWDLFTEQKYGLPMLEQRLEESTMMLDSLRVMIGGEKKAKKRKSLMMDPEPSPPIEPMATLREPMSASRMIGGVMSRLLRPGKPNFEQEGHGTLGRALQRRITW